MSVPETLDDLPRRCAGWAVSRSLAPVSVAGISVALAVCAAGWFSAGTRPGNVNGALALCVSYLVGCAARQLASPRRGASARHADADAGRLADWCATASEYAVYGGLARGGIRTARGRSWAARGGGDDRAGGAQYRGRVQRFGRGGSPRQHPRR